MRTPQGQDARDEEGGGVSRSGGAGGGGSGQAEQLKALSLVLWQEKEFPTLS